MRTLKSVITKVVYDRKTGKKSITTVTGEEWIEIDACNREREARIRAKVERERKKDELASRRKNKKRKPRKGTMNGMWMKRVYAS